MRPAADAVSVALMAVWGKPLFSTSANRRGEPPAVLVSAALDALGGAPGGQAIEIALMAVESCEASADTPGSAPGLPSTIVEVGAGPARIVREGAISTGAIREAVGDLQDRR